MACTPSKDGIGAQWRLRSAWASIQSDLSLHCPHEESLGPYLPIERTAKTLIRLSRCPGWSESSLGTYAILLVLSCAGSYIKEYRRLWSDKHLWASTVCICHNTLFLPCIKSSGISLFQRIRPLFKFYKMIWHNFKAKNHIYSVFEKQVWANRAGPDQTMQYLVYVHGLQCLPLSRGFWAYPQVIKWGYLNFWSSMVKMSKYSE